MTEPQTSAATVPSPVNVTNHFNPSNYDTLEFIALDLACRYNSTPDTSPEKVVSSANLFLKFLKGE